MSSLKIALLHVFLEPFKSSVLGLGCLTLLAVATLVNTGTLHSNGNDADRSRFPDRRQNGGTQWVTPRPAPQAFPVQQPPII